ncbi:MAG: hypothetical protein ABWX87_01155 [Pseudoxanthomonas sp.]
MRSVTTAITQEWDEDASGTLVAQVGRREQVDDSPEGAARKK